MMQRLLSPRIAMPDFGRYRWSSVLGWIQAHPARFLLLVFVAVTAALTLRLAARGTLGMPPAPRDATAYENIAFNLARGRGFRFDWDNQEWRALYEQHNSDHRYDYLYPITGSWPTAFRPPLLPLLIAANHLVFGRQFVSVRIGNVLLVAAMLCLAAAVARRLIGPLGALLVPLLAVPDRRMLSYSEAILTEYLALFSVALLTWLLIRLFDRPSAGNAILAGATLGSAVLARTIFVLWYPLLTPAVFLLVRHAQASRNTRRALALATLFLAAAIAVPTPWWVRNCLLLDAFMPLGTQGGIALPGGYSDVAWRSGRGNWIGPRTWSLFDPLVRSEGYRELPGHLQERERARFGARYAAEWIKRNPEKLPVLAWRRLRDHIRPRSVYELILLGLAFGGLVLARRHPLARLLAAVVATNALAVMATYAAGGRFLIPVRGSLYVLAAVGLAGMGRWLTAEIERRQRRE
jgi:hypothetical protein